MAATNVTERICLSSETLVCKENFHTFYFSTKRTTKSFIFYVPGTTDPINLDYNKKTDASEAYWADNPAYADLETQIKNLNVNRDIDEIIRDFRWNGDNSEPERVKAGEALLHFILRKTTNKIGADTPIEIHLIGHSHGGNVINEFTKKAAAAPNFPRLLKIKTIVYLSVPFFKNQAQLDTSKFHEKCKILNVHNEYDLTQRFVANFSMYQMPILLQKLSSEKDKDGNLIGDKRFYDAKQKLTNGWRFLEMIGKTGFMTLDFGLAGKVINNIAGKSLWEDVISLFEDFKEVILSLNSIFESINNEHPRFITEEIFNELTIFLDSLLRYVESIISNLEKRKGNYSLISLIEDVATGLLRLISGINFFFKFKGNPNTESLKSDFITLLDKIILNQIDTFDNTYTDPKAQVKDACELIDDPVTKNDLYDECPESESYKKWIVELERNETDYERLGESGQKGPDGAELRAEMVCKLIAQIDLVYDIIDGAIKYSDYFKWFIHKFEYDQIDWFKETLNELRDQLDLRNRGITSKIDIDNGKGLLEQRGSIGYLAVVAHSVSRIKLNYNTSDIWYKQFYFKDKSPIVEVGY